MKKPTSLKMKKRASVSRSSLPKLVTKGTDPAGKRTVFLSSLGSGLEYYDFVIYGMMAPYLGPLFFPSSSSFSSFLQVFSVFALGYVVRPLGGFLFGRMADQRGRRQAFLILMGLMALSTVGIGLLPSYEKWGIFSSLLLVFGRVVQGISLGAELPGAMVMVTETSKPEAHGRRCSWVISSTGIGALAASFVLFLISYSYSREEILAWGWRIPFLVGGFSAGLFLFLRRKLEETPAFKAFQANKVGQGEGKTFSFREFWEQESKKWVWGVGLYLFPVSLVITNLYFPVYMVEHFGYKQTAVYKAMTWGLGVGAFMIPFLGWLGDKVSFNRLKFFRVMIGIGWVSAPFFYTALKIGDEFSLISFMIWYQFLIGACQTTCFPILASLFPTGFRYTGVALTYNLTYVIGGFLPSLMTFGIHTTGYSLFLPMVLWGISLFSFVSVLVFERKKRKSYDNDPSQ